MGRLVELSHPIEHGTITYPGLPGPVVGAHLTFDESHERYAEGYEFTIGSVTMVANTGTYLDTPAHRYRDGHDLAGLPLERCADLETLVVDAEGAIDAAAVDSVRERVPRDGAVLFRTGWDRHWGTDSYGDSSHPHVTDSGATALVDAGVALVGIDSVNIDGTADGRRPAHSILLGAGIYVLEHLTGLAELPRTGARLTAAPPLFRGLATFPVRAFAALP